ncbi:MAG: type II toxin-antitoxin system RelE/ParE family toxin [Bacteroidota bacterium]
MAKRVIFSRRAFLDIDRIIEFNDKRNQSDTYSRKFVVNLHKRLKVLLKQPLSGMDTQRDNTLLLIWDQFYIFYKVDDVGIEVKSIYHQKEDLNR